MKLKSAFAHTRLIPVAFACFAASIAAATTQASATTIDFETGAPSLFIQTTALTTYYSGLGVTFSGVNGYGGSILNQAGNFGINARSGVDFLAFNTGVGSGNIEQVTFASPVSNFQIYVGVGGSQSYFAESYTSGGSLIQSTSVTPADGVYGELSLSGGSIGYVQFGTNGSVFVADDLSFNTSRGVPEMSTWTMLLAGFAGLGLAGYRRTRRPALSSDNG
jgi:hypothetical protein